MALVLVTLTATGVACGGHPQVATPRKLTLATGWSGTAWDIVGRALADQYRHRVPGLDVAAEPIADLYEKADALQRGDLDLALVDAETAYRAYKTGTPNVPRPHPRLRAIAVLFPTVVQIVARADANISTPSQLRGKRVDVGLKAGYADQALQLILESYGLDSSTVQILSNSAVPPETAFGDHQIDALAYWAPLHQPAITRVVDAVPSTLVALDYTEISLLQRRNHFLKSAVIPAHSYPNQDRDVLTVGEDVLLVCRQELPDDLVLQLTRALFDAVPSLRRAHAAAGGFDPLRGPTASIPLHSGAARYYRERELLK